MGDVQHYFVVILLENVNIRSKKSRFMGFLIKIYKRNQKDRSINNCFNKSNFLSERDQYLLIKIIDTCVQIREIINNGLP